MTVYWGSLHQMTLVEYADLPYIATVHTYVVHSAPAITFLLNFLMTDIVMKHSHSLVLLVFGLLYGTVNYYETVSSGAPLYWFLDWKDMTSVYIYGGLVASVILCYHVLVVLTKSMKTLAKDKRA